jgi:hypothetical protein
MGEKSKFIVQDFYENFAPSVPTGAALENSLDKPFTSHGRVTTTINGFVILRSEQNIGLLRCNTRPSDRTGSDALTKF